MRQQGVKNGDGADACAAEGHRVVQWFREAVARDDCADAEGEDDEHGENIQLPYWTKKKRP